MSLLCGHLLQQEVAIFRQGLPRHRRVASSGMQSGNYQRQLSASRLLLCFFRWCVNPITMELFIPIVHAIRYNPAVSRNSLTKWQPPRWLVYRKAGVSHAAPTPPTVVAQAWFHIKSLVVLLLINITTLQLQCFLLLYNLQYNHEQEIYCNQECCSRRVGNEVTWQLVWICGIVQLLVILLKSSSDWEIGKLQHWESHNLCSFIAQSRLLMLKVHLPNRQILWHANYSN